MRAGESLVNVGVDGQWHGDVAWGKEMQCSALHILSRYGSILSGLLSAWEGSFPRLRLQADPLHAW